jgi:hypothetical protein
LRLISCFFKKENQFFSGRICGKIIPKAKSWPFTGKMREWMYFGCVDNQLTNIAKYCERSGQYQNKLGTNKYGDGLRKVHAEYAMISDIIQ